MKKEKSVPSTGSYTLPTPLAPLFEESDGKPTKTALFLQDILKFEVSCKEKGFRSQELAHWLLKNNHELAGRYASSREKKSSLVHNILERVKDNLALLTVTGLVVPIDRVGGEKNKVPTFIYGLTEDGTFVALVIEYKYTQSEIRRQQLSDVIYGLCMSHLERIRGASAMFLLRLFKTFKEEGILPSVISSTTAFVMEHPVARPLDNFVSLDNPLFWLFFAKDAVLEALSELDKDSQSKVLMHLKVTIEEYYRAVPCMSVEWESAWLGARDKEDNIVVEGMCLQCGKRQAIVLDTILDIDKLQRLLAFNNWPVEVTAECINCKKSSGLPIFPLGPRRLSKVA